MSAATVDFDALAKQHGGIDFDALASQHGGTPAPANAATIQAVHEPDSPFGKAEQWARDVADDVRYGTDHTGIGTVLKKMGARGVYGGNSQTLGEFMGSLPLGLLKMVQGGAEVGGGKTAQGSKDFLSGGLQAATIPSYFVAPERAALEEAAPAATAAAKAAPAVERATQAAQPAKTAQPAAQPAIDPLLQRLRDIAAKIQQEESVAQKTPPAGEGDLTDILKESVKQAKAAKKPPVTAPRVPEADEDLTQLLMQSLLQARSH